MTAQEQYWYKIMMQRRAAMHAYMTYAHNLAKKVSYHILAGGDPMDPGYKDDYCWLIDELGEKFFIDELEKFRLEKENDKKQQF